MAGTITTSTIQNDTSSPPTFRNNSVEIGTLCRAWVNFDGTGTVAIRGSFNVTSITDGGTGAYTVNFTTAMPDTNYSAVTTCENLASFNFMVAQAPTRNTTSVVLDTRSNAGSVADARAVYVAVFR